MTGSEPAPGIDPRQASPGRVYDCLLGGKDNFAVDRELAEQILAHAPRSRWIVRENRAFLRRAMHYCAEQGIRQFLDLGSGLPTADNVHEVVQRVDRACRVVYVDNDPMVVAHAQALLADGAGVAAIKGDVRRPAEILRNDDVRRLIDFSRPMAVVMVAILHFFTDEDDPAGIVARFMEVAASGSHLVLSHGTHDVRSRQTAQVSDLYKRAAIPLITRSKCEIDAFFVGLELVEPGLVFAPQWRPHPGIGPPESRGPYVAVARKPSPQDRWDGKRSSISSPVSPKSVRV